MTGSTKTKKTITKPKVPQSVIDNWLNGHPDVNPSGFTFSMLKDLKLTGSTKTIKSSADTKTLVSKAKKDTYDLIKKLKTGDTFSVSALTKSVSAKTFTTSANIVKGEVNFVKSSGSTGPHRVKSTPVSLSGVTKSTPSPKKLLKTGLSLSEPSLVFTAGTVDYSFPNGDNYGFTSTIYDIKVQSDGKILVAGDTSQTYYYDGSGWDMQGLIRLNEDGTVDETFDILFNEDCYGGGFNDTVYTIEIQPDGKILCGGSFTSFDRNGNCNDAYRLIRLNSDGSRDLTFNTGNGFNDEVYDIQLQPNGKILVGGYFDTYNGTSAYNLIRLNSNGSVDISFSIGDFDNYVNKILLQSDGKILCGGYFTSYSSVTQSYITRLNSDGTLDTTFQVGNGFNDEVYDMALQSDGKIIVGGYFDTYDNNDLFGGHIIRLDSNGSIDTLFGYGLDGPVHSLAIQSNGKILVGGNISDYYPDNYTTLSVDELIRFNADCSFDYSFYYEELFNGVVETIHILPDGKLLVGGAFDTDSDPATFPLNYFGRLNNSITTYPYVYLGYQDWCFDITGSSLVTVGSMTPPVLSIGGPENVYSFNNLKNPSQTQIGLAFPGGQSEFFEYPTNIIDFVQGNDYGFDGCLSAINDNYSVALARDVFETFPDSLLFVDKKFKIGDIGFVSAYAPDSYYGEIYVHSTFEIIDLIPFPGPYYVLPALPVPYIPYSSAEESVSINGQYIVIYDCHAPCGSFALSKQYDICLNGGTISFLNCTSCGYVEEVVSVFCDDGPCPPYSEISGGTPTINSTKVWDTCTECATNSTPQGERNYDFYNGGFNNQVESIVEQPDGKILVGGGFTNFDGGENVVNYLTRLNSDGTLDTTFNAENNRLNLVNPNSPVSIWKQQGYIFTLDYDNNEINVFKVVGNKMTSVISNYNVSGELPFQIYGDGKYLYVLYVSDGSPGIGVYEFNTSTESLNYITTNSEYFSLPYSQMWGDDEFIYATTAENFEGNQTLKAYKLSGGTLSVVGEYTGDTFSNYNSVFVQNGYIFVGTNTGLWVLTFNGTEFTYITDYSVTTDSVAVNGDGTHIYLADWGTGEGVDSTLFAFSFDGESLTEITSADVSGQLGNLNTIWCDSEGIIWMSSGWDQYSYLLLGYELIEGTFYQVRDLNFDQYNQGIYPIGIINDDVNYYILTSQDIRFYNLSESDNNYFIERGFDNPVYSIEIQLDGKILVGGSFSNYNGKYAGKIIRLNSDGSIDNSFTYGEEFDNDVYVIAVQNDGKIVVGGEFSYYYDYECYGYVRLNSDGTPDTTFKQYPFEGGVYSILLENDNKTQYYTGVDNKTQNIIIGGWFGMDIPELQLTLGCLAKFGPDGTFINTYKTAFTNYFGGVYDMKKQSDGKLVCVGGFSGYRNNYCPFNIIRINTNGTQDTSFVGKISDDGGGFNDGWVYSVEILPNGKMMIGNDSQYFYDRTDNYEDLGFLVRLNSDGTLDTTFTYVLDDNSVYNVLLRKDKTLLVGGDFENPTNFFFNMFIGEDFQLRAFNTCDGSTANIYLPSTFKNTYVGGSLSPITSIDYSEITTGGLDLFVDGSYDDDYWTVGFPSGFSVNFLQTNYTSVNVSSNPFITFGDPEIGNEAGDCCFDIPDEIPNSTEQPGVYLSFQCPDSPGDYDAELYELYSGLTDGGNTMVIKYVGSDHCDEIATLIYGFRFYKNESSYFDLVIEENTNFFNDNPIGGVSNGVDPTWVSTFDSSSLKAYRISAETIKPIKADINTSNVVCGKVGDVITIPQGDNSKSIGGSMYFDGIAGTMVQVDNGGGQFGFGGTNDFTIEWFQYYEGGSNARPFSIGVYNNLSEMIGMSFEGTVYLWIDNSSYTTNITNEDLLNGWHHIAITRNYNGADHIWRVFLDGVEKVSLTGNTDTSNIDILTLGNQLNNDGRFQGYITNFRVTNLTALYTSDFTVPTQPLYCDAFTILTMDATNQSDLLYDSCEYQSIAATGVTWSSNSPFFGFPIYYTSTDTDTKYDDCDTCLSTVLYNTKVYVRDGGVTPDYVKNVLMTYSDIQNVLTNGPIFTIVRPECYEILTYNL